MKEEGTESAPLCEYMKKLTRKRGLEFLDIGHSTETDCKLHIYLK